jgi:hypothetical protein
MAIPKNNYINNAQQIKMFYTASILRKEYRPIMELHTKGEISDIEFLMRCNTIKNNEMRKNFKSLKDVDEEVKQIF